MRFLPSAPMRRAFYCSCGVVGLVLLCPSTIAQSHHPRLYEPGIPAPLHPQTLAPEDRAHQADASAKPDGARAGKRHRAADRQELKWRLAEIRQRSNTLVALANSLDNDLASITETQLPAGVVERAEKIERLAKEIKNWGKGL